MNLKELLSVTEYILKETNALFEKACILWSGGKDSTALLYMIFDTFGRIPFRVVHLDNGKEFRETYKHMESVSKELRFEILRERVEIKRDNITGLTCCGHNKTEALKRVIKRQGFDAVIVGIRWDEHGIRGMERYFSPRDREFKWNVYNPHKGQTGEALQEPEFVNWGIVVSDFGENCNHVRVHPLLHWREVDVWRYVRGRGVQVNPLYFARNGMRYRSIGCTECSLPVKSKAKNVLEVIKEIERMRTKEREGRVQDKELAMERLRALGYM